MSIIFKIMILKILNAKIRKKPTLAIFLAIEI